MDNGDKFIIEVIGDKVKMDVRCTPVDAFANAIEVLHAMCDYMFKENPLIGCNYIELAEQLLQVYAARNCEMMQLVRNRLEEIGLHIDDEDVTDTGTIVQR